MKLFDEVKKAQEIGNRLRQAIKDSPYTQEEFAEACGTTYQTLRTHMKGYSFYRVDILLKASRLLGVSYEYLLGEEDYKIIPEDYFAERTHLSKETIDKLIKLGSKYTETGYNYEMNVLKAIDQIMSNDSLLEVLSNYLLHSRLKQRDYSYAINSKETRYFNKIDAELQRVYGRISDETLNKMHMYELVSEFEKLGEKKRRK